VRLAADRGAVGDAAASRSCSALSVEFLRAVNERVPAAIAAGTAAVALTDDKVLSPRFCGRAN